MKEGEECKLGMAFVGGGAYARTEGKTRLRGVSRTCQCRPARRRNAVIVRSNEDVDAGSAPDENASTAADDAAEGVSAEVTSPPLETDFSSVEKIRKQYFRMKSYLGQAVKLERYGDAAKFRDNIKSLRQRDPLLLVDDLGQQLKEAEVAEDYQKCIEIRDRITELRARLPQYRLSGRWGGMFPGVGVEKIDVTIEGNTLRGRRVAGDKRQLFTADISLRGALVDDLDEKIRTELQKLPFTRGIQRFRAEAEIMVPVMPPGAGGPGSEGATPPGAPPPRRGAPGGPPRPGSSPPTGAAGGRGQPPAQRGRQPPSASPSTPPSSLRGGQDGMRGAGSAGNAAGRPGASSRRPPSGAPGGGAAGESPAAQTPQTVARKIPAQLMLLDEQVFAFFWEPLGVIVPFERVQDI